MTGTHIADFIEGSIRTNIAQRVVVKGLTSLIFMRVALHITLQDLMMSLRVLSGLTLH